MKICVISARFYPQLVGSGTSAYVIASELSKRGHDVVVLTDASLRGDASHKKLTFTVDYIQSLEDFAIGKASFRDALVDLRNHLKTYQPDIIHVCNFMPMLLVSIIRQQIKCPVIFSFFNTPVIGQRTTGYFHDPNLDTSLGTFILQQRAYDQIILGSKHYVDAAISLGADPKDIRLSYLAPDTSSFGNDSDDFDSDAIVRKYFPGKEMPLPYILLPSRITAQKGIIEAIEALAIVNQRSQQPHKLLLTGMAKPFDAAYAKEVQARISELDLSENIITPNTVIDRKDLGLFFKKATLVLIPSWYEGLGLAAIEAQFLGVPLAVSDTTGLNEVVEDDINGVLFRPRDPKEIADATLKVLNNEVDVASLVKNAKKTVVKFSLHQHISDLEESYALALEGCTK